ncbi:FadR/GntR family transcriptional regulator [Paenarthrobacter sp. NPDC091711]|uniref:FadR/GntR family transcriptional regulator n=1 Tax=Paenarthrobacter sp. NPDC091711 TaxID=3364385 RepID=UPI0037F62377
MLGDPRTRELVELRSGLEVQAVELAALRVNDEALQRMRANLEAMQKSVDDLAAFGEADAASHREIAAASGNVVLEELLPSIPRPPWINSLASELFTRKFSSHAAALGYFDSVG